MTPDHERTSQLVEIDAVLRAARPVPGAAFQGTSGAGS